jgi:hypothetical protein
VEPSEANFLLRCRTIDQYGREIEQAPEHPHPKNSDASWKNLVRGVYSVVFVLVWIAGVASFFFFGSSFRKGSPVPTETQTEPPTDHGKTVYVTRSEKERIDSFQLVVWVGIPLVLVSAVVLHFLVGVKLFANAPTLSEYRAERNPSASNPPPTKLH